MKDSLILEGKTYISANRASKLINYAQDYIGQLCRAGKLECKMVGRSWFVTEESLHVHREIAIESTEERVAKIIEKNRTEIKATIQNKIQPEAKPAHTLKYESERKSFLPEITKKVPVHFSLPVQTKSPLMSSTIPMSSAISASTLSLNHLVIALAIGGIAVSGYFFTASLSSFLNNATRSNNQAAAVSATAPATSESSGIVVVPSDSKVLDEAVKENIKNSFSDEVVINPDQSGAAGIVTPVFKKTNGNDFVYVLVPVKEKK